MVDPSGAARVTVSGIPSVSFEGDRLVFGNLNSSLTRSYTPLKTLGNSAFARVQLCDLHSDLPLTSPLPAMQSGTGVRPEWAEKRLVVIKQAKKREDGWSEHTKPRELDVLQAISTHPNIISLYDAFLVPDTNELCLVFEPMEGNLYHLMKIRNGRTFAGGLIASIFHQMVASLDHLHSSGYIHRDLKPENILVTTTGMFDYTSTSPLTPPNAPKERDIICLIKLADLGNARKTTNTTPYTEYMATRWYRAPEALLLSPDCSTPVDMWGLGTILAELLNLQPLFPGYDQINQIHRICNLLGDPGSTYDASTQNGYRGGGPWPAGVRIAAAMGFQFPKMEPKDIHSWFKQTIPTSLIDCIGGLLRHDPSARLTSRQCLEHPYLLETLPLNNIPFPSVLGIPVV
ncbi:kinase-like domain-containing protein [Collybia nuda]|uniref:Kinase-like domain-containing protein n=1 Tax=Collybia nuda TaxID=64659 RepID=A0A9P6CKS3_9AGAR|nr:kinase-like domain-containing protein [Collybia nuda]